MQRENRLAQLGWAGADQYAAFYGLSGLARLDEHLERPRFCNHPDVMPIRSVVPVADFTWDVLSPVGQLGLDGTVRLVELAMARWAAVAPIRPRRVPGGPVRLAVCGGGLAPASSEPGRLRLADAGWVVRDGPGPGPGPPDLLRVVVHHVGHAVGLNHSPPPSVMSPVYDDEVWLPPGSPPGWRKQPLWRRSEWRRSLES